MSYIAPREKVLRYLDRVIDRSRGESPGPVTVEWDLSNRCPLGCQACHFAHTHTRGQWVLQERRLPMAFDGSGDLADITLVRRALGEMRAARVRSLVWSGGGEPTTHPEWRVAVNAAAALGFQQGMYTLGGLLSAEDAAYLGARAAWVVVSLDAITPEAYAREKASTPARFGAACDAIRALARTQTTVGVSCLLHGGNYRQAGDMVAYGHALGADYVTLRPAIHTSPDRPGIPTDDRSWVAEALPVLRWLSEREGVEIDVARFREYAEWCGHGYDVCQGPALNTTVTPDGRVWVCPQRRGVGGSCIGDLRVESFETLWRRHPGAWTVDAGCRAMCRLHPINQTLADLQSPIAHGAFL